MQAICGDGGSGGQGEEPGGRRIRKTPRTISLREMSMVRQNRLPRNGERHPRDEIGYWASRGTSIEEKGYQFTG